MAGVPRREGDAEGEAGEAQGDAQTEMSFGHSLGELSQHSVCRIRNDDP